MIPVDRKISAPKPVFTPVGFKKAYAKYKKGDRRPLVSMMREAAADGFVRGLLTGRRAGVVRSFTVHAFDDSEEHIRRRDWFVHTIRKRLKTRRLFKAILDARLFGYNVVEFDWEVIDGLMTPIAFRPYDQRFFRHVGEDPFQELRIDRGRTTEEIPEAVLVVEELDEPPVMLSVLDRYILLNFGWETWSGWMETWGEGILVAERPQNWKGEKKRELNDDLRNLGAAGRGSVPTGTKLHHFGPPSGTAGHQDYKLEAQADMSVAVLGHAEGASRSNGTQIGENSTSLEVRDEVAVDDLGFLDDALADVARILWAQNWADGTEPEVETHKPRRIDQRHHRENVRLALDAGMTVHPDEFAKLDLFVYPDQGPLRRERSLLPLD